MNFYSSNDTMKAWLNSETHRKNILLPEFKDIGIAVGSGMINNQKTTVVVQVFGSPKAVSLMPTTLNVLEIRSMVLPIARAQSDISFSDNKSNSYAFNLFLQGFMIIIFAIILTIMLLKIFVNINIQIPELVLRGVILILLSAAFITIKDRQIINLLYGNVIIP